jgi:ribosomal protein L36
MILNLHQISHCYIRSRRMGRAVYPLRMGDMTKKVKLSLKEALEAYKVVRRRGSHVLYTIPKSSRRWEHNMEIRVN